MPVPATGRDLHIDVPLSNIVVGRRPEGFIADQILPMIPVSKQSNIYNKFNYKEWYRHEPNISLRAPRAEARKLYFGVSSDTYYAKNYALGTDWTVEDAVNADEMFAWAESSAIFLADKLMIDYEYRIAALATTSSNVGTIMVAASSWVGASTKPLTDILNWKESFRKMTGKEPNTCIIPETTMINLRLNDQLRGIRFGSNNGGIISAADLGAMIGISKILVPKLQINTAVEADPQDGNLADVWGGNGNFWMMYTETLGGRFTDTWAQAFRWTSPLFGTPMAIQRHPFDAKRRTYDIEASYYQDEKIVSADLAMRVSSLSV